MDLIAVMHRNFSSAKIGYILIKNIFQVPQKQGLVNPSTDLRFHLETGVQWLQFLSGHYVLQKLELQWLPETEIFLVLTKWQVADQSRISVSLMVIQNTIKPLRVSFFLSPPQSLLLFTIDLHNFTFFSRCRWLWGKKDDCLRSIYDSISAK